MVFHRLMLPITKWLPRYYAGLRYADNEGPVLDAACGTGLVTIELMSKIRQEVVGADLSRRGLLEALNHGGKKGLKLNLVLCDLRALPFRTKVFKQIISLDTLEHIDDDGSVFKEFRRTLKPFGILILTVPTNATNSAKLFTEQRLLRKVIPSRLYSRYILYNGKTWLEASSSDSAIQLGHLRNYSKDRVTRENGKFFETISYEYALKRFATIVTDITYGVRGFLLLQPFMFFLAVRLDFYLQMGKQGYLLVLKMRRTY